MRALALLAYGPVVQVERHDTKAGTGHALVVDDVDDTRELYAEVLEDEGFRVVMAAHAEDGLEKAFADRPDIVIMDHSLPGMDGCEATRILKDDPRTASVPVIMVTGHALTSLEELARKCGADDFRTKPLSPSDLVKLVRQHLARVRAR